MELLHCTKCHHEWWLTSSEEPQCDLCGAFDPYLLDELFNEEQDNAEQSTENLPTSTS